MGKWIEEYIALLSKNLEEEALQLKLENFPNSFYKYRSLNENNISCLNSNSVWMSPAESLNDPYESSLCFNDDNLLLNFFKCKDFSENFNNQYGQSISQDEIKEIINNNNPQLKFQEICKAKGIHRDFSKGQKTREKIFTFFSNSKKKQIRICSFSERRDSMLMWSHYSDGHKGFCIEYDFKNNSDVTYYMEPVFYSDKVFDITPYLGINSKRFAIKIAAITKAEDWKYEQEWRLTFPLSIQDLEKGLYRINAPKAIYLGTRFEENPIDKKNKFLKVAEHLNIQVLQMVAHKSEFKIIPA